VPEAVRTKPESAKALKTEALYVCHKPKTFCKPALLAKALVLDELAAVEVAL
jgi:hypothetical protein